ncbi:hypothetical protein OEZ85_012188 [Tetradesmus obliquus]|uniref:RNA polymerase II subunit B1 CTD phosphatase RPAP2 homolog n=1 Tax=Tetradesmus obliquus TaxID=3088 RepID=A0ABY8TSL5_TETOB|nr:hypothetical protein OEZ85_012188 [Tetradesmus obliquus]
MTTQEVLRSLPQCQQADQQDTAAAAAVAWQQHQQQQSKLQWLKELSRERRRRAFIGMLKLLEHGAADERQLQQLVAPMSDEELLQVAEERSLAGKCGNPLCSNPFSWQEPRVKYRASADNIHKVEGDCYCSRACASFTQALAAQLVEPMSRLQPDALQAYLSKPSHRPQQQQQQGVAAQGGGVETMKSVIEERDPFQLIHEAEEAGRQLQAAAAASTGDSTAAAAVEGYVPRRTPGKQPRPQQQQQEDAEAEPMEQARAQASSSAAVGGGGVGPATSSNARHKILVVHSSSSSDDEDSGSDSEQGDSEASDQDCFGSASATHTQGNRNSSKAVSRPAASGGARAANTAAAAVRGGSSSRANGSSRRHRSSSGSSSSSSSSGSDEEDDEANDMLQNDDDDEMSEGGGAWGAAASDSEEGLGLEEGLTGALQNVLPFLDTRGVTVHLSEFGLMWNTLHGWVSPATVDYVNSRQQQQQSAGSVHEASSSDDHSANQQQQQQDEEEDGQQQQQPHVPPLAVVQQRTALANLLGQALPLVTQQLDIQPAALPDISRHLHALVRSFYMPGPLPALQQHQWQLLVALLLGALSAWRLPGLRPLFNRAEQGQGQGGGEGKLGVLLAGLGSDVGRFMALLDLFELQV